MRISRETLTLLHWAGDLEARAALNAMRIFGCDFYYLRSEGRLVACVDSSAALE